MIPYSSQFLEVERRNIARIAARIESREKRSASEARECYEVSIPQTTVSYKMVAVPEGEFLMGSALCDPFGKEIERPQHRVEVSAFWMQAHAVTWDEYQLFMFDSEGKLSNGEDDLDAVSRPTKPYVDMSFGMGISGYPAISMTQHAANKYAEWLSAQTGEFYRLPTEAEWEYACRGGTTTSFYFGSDMSLLPEYAWFAENSGGGYHKVATRKPNAWGLYDMLGNVMEWTLDQYACYREEYSIAPWARPTKPYPLAVRGGSWVDLAEDVRCAARVPSDPSWKRQDPQLPKSIWYETDAPWLGFRLIRPAALCSEDEMFACWNNGVAYDEE